MNPPTVPGLTADAVQATATAASSDPRPLAESPPPQPSTLQKLPQTEQQSLWSAFHAARRAVQPLTEYESSLPQNKDVRFFASNPGQEVTVRFLDGAVRIESGRGGTWSGTLRFTDAAQSRRTAVPAIVAADGCRVAYQHGDGVTEWYENKAEGIEHGYALIRRPGQAARDGSLRIALRVEGLEVRPSRKMEGALEFVDAATGRAVLLYSGLRVWDARGGVLEARLEAGTGGAEILVADAEAVYPVMIDPLITSQEAKLGPEITGDGDARDGFGASLALAGDTVLVGAYVDDRAAGDDAGSVYVFVRNGNGWSQQAQLAASDARGTGFFGRSVAIEGDTALVGAPGLGIFSEGTYVFERSGSTWTQRAKLTPSSAIVGNRFGNSVALEGDTALMGAPGEVASGRGSAYVFFRNGPAWAEVAKLTASDGASGDNFGESVDLSGDTALIGAVFGDTAAGSNTGSAYVFVRSAGGWRQQAKLTRDGGRLYDYFGSSVALSGDTALIGAYLDDHSENLEDHDAGSAYVFVRSGGTWSPQAVLRMPDSFYFGDQVALSGNTALVGAYFDDMGTRYDTGSAFVFVRNGAGWSYEAKLTADDAQATDQLGTSVALDGDAAVVGAAWDDTPAGHDAGSAYLFIRSGSTWSQTAHLTAGDAAVNDDFGYSVALAADTALVGAPGDDTAAGEQAGTAYVFVRANAIWSPQTRLTAGSNASGEDNFGNSVALAGDLALIGAFHDSVGFNGGAGSAYVFARNGTAWSQQARLTASDARASDNFGNSVSLTNDTALVGAYNADTPAAGFDAGSAYVFGLNGGTWSQRAKLAPSDALTARNFGVAVALSQGTALVGATLPDDLWGSGYLGGAYVFVRSGNSWSQQAKLTGDLVDPYASFGCSVALSGDTALVGACHEDTAAGFGAGSAYLFIRNGITWSRQAKLTADDAADGDRFGNSVALAGGTALVGAYFDDAPAGANEGSVYVYGRSGTVWSQQAKLTAGDAVPYDSFGYCIALSGDTALVGMPADDSTYGPTNETRGNHGSMYVFRLTDPAATPRDPRLAIQPNGHAVILFLGGPGRLYELQRSSNLQQWATLGTSNPAADGSASFTDTAPLPGRAYYRVLLVP